MALKYSGPGQPGAILEHSESFCPSLSGHGLHWYAKHRPTHMQYFCSRLTSVYTHTHTHTQKTHTRGGKKQGVQCKHFFLNNSAFFRRPGAQYAGPRNNKHIHQGAARQLKRAPLREPRQQWGLGLSRGYRRSSRLLGYGAPLYWSVKGRTQRPSQLIMIKSTDLSTIWDVKSIWIET